MFLFDWMYNMLGWLGMRADSVINVCYIAGLYQKSARILFLGLDNAGKTYVYGLVLLTIVFVYY